MVYTIMTFWTEEKVKELHELNEKGYTPRQIGVKLGATRNAVLGRLFRDKKKTGHNPIANYDRSSNENYYFKKVGKRDCYICNKEFVMYSKFDRFCKSCKTSDYYKHN